MAKQWGLVSKLQQRVAAPTVEGFLSQDQIHCLQQALVSFLNGFGHSCTMERAPYQPFLLTAWRAIAALTTDVDFSLADILLEGVPAGILEPVQASGVWERLSFEPDADHEADLLVHREPWQSAQQDPQLTWQLLEKDLRVGVIWWSLLVVKLKVKADGEGTSQRASWVLFACLEKSPV